MDGSLRKVVLLEGERRARQHGEAITLVVDVGIAKLRDFGAVDLVDEVKNDAAGRKLVHDAFFGLIEKFGLVHVACVVKDLNDAVIAVAAAERGFDDSRPFRLASVNLASESPHGHMAHFVVGMEGAHPIVSFLAVLVECRRIRERRVEAVEVPVLSTVVALDHCTLGSAIDARRCMAARIASDQLALAVAKLGVIWLLFGVTRAISDESVS